MTKKRTPISPDQSAQILFASDRTCCICNIRGKRVQIHHIDEDPNNNAFENLSVLCFDCHDETQIRGGFGKHLTAPVVKKYRDDWLVRVKQRREKADSFAISKVIGESIAEEPSMLTSPSDNDLYAYLDSLPAIRLELMSQAQSGWDTGITAVMNQANYNYIDGLQGILVGLAKFYSPNAFDNQEPHEFFSEIISNRYRWHRAQLEPDGPGTGGTIITTLLGGSVSADVEKMIGEMVSSLIGYSDGYSLKHWLRLWNSSSQN